MNIVRESKYRHVFGTPAKIEFCFNTLRPKTSAWDQNFVACSGKYFAIPWQSGGGSVAIFQHSEPGKKKPDSPCFTGHTGEILDIDFNPFNDHVLASGSFDCSARIWNIPEGGLKESSGDASVVFEHKNKVASVRFHNIAENLLFTAEVDKYVYFWDIIKQEEKIQMETNISQINSVDFNLNGTQFATTSKDKKTRVFDIRSKKMVAEVEGHQGTKGSRIQWFKKLDKIFTVGFTKIAEREMKLYDPRKMEEPLTTETIDSASSILMPFFDEDNSILFLAGKGDSSIRYYEVDAKDNCIHLLSSYSSSVPQKGMGMVPKYALDVAQCEVTRLLKLTQDSVIPIMFQVPRKSTMFQSDIFPDTFSYEPALTLDEFFAGKDAKPKTIKVEPSKNPYKKKKYVGLETSGTSKQETNEELEKKYQALLKENEELKKELEALKGNQ